jgi:hypothetical protein
MPDRDDYIREFERATADLMSAHMAFTNAVIAARKAGISDQELAAVAGMDGTEISQILSTTGAFARRASRIEGATHRIEP